MLGPIDRLAASTAGRDEVESRERLLQFHRCAESRFMNLPAFVTAIHEQRFALCDIDGSDGFAVMLHHRDFFDAAVETQMRVANRLKAYRAGKDVVV